MNKTRDHISLRRWIGRIKSRLIYDFKPYNRSKMVRFYGTFIRQGDLCFDIGAHTGNRTAAWLSMGARVVAVEPQPAFIRLLKKRFSANPRFSIEKSALGRNPGNAMLFISRMNPAISTLSPEWKKVMTDYDPSVRWEDQIETEVHTLDEMILRHGKPVFCKIDVEGYEGEVLAGLSAALPSLSFEFFPTTPDRAVHCIDILEKLGKYSYNWSLTESFRMNAQSWLTASDMILNLKAYTGNKSGDIYARLSP
jgi:FkbM family methyltransferase